jgi:hypothetical protein
MWLQRTNPLLFATALTLLPVPQEAMSPTAAPPNTGAPTYTIAGTIVSKTEGRALAHARVMIANVKDLPHPRSMVTGDDGAFSFSELPAGKYELEGAKRGFMDRGYEQHEMFSTAIVTGAGLDTEHLLLRLPPDAYIVGRVLDENGEPLRRASVQLYVVNHYEGFSRASQSRGAQTDDLGAYEFGPQLPGTYYVAARAEPWYAVHPPQAGFAARGQAPLPVDPSLDVAYPVTYYGDTTDPDAATPIQVRGGERFPADIHLGPVPALHLLVHVPQANGSNAPQFLQLRQSGLDGDAPVAGARMISPGLFEITGIPAGHYSADFLGGPNGLTTSTEVNATTEGQEIETAAAEANSTVKLKVQIAGGTTVPPQLTIALRIARGRVKFSTGLDAKGEGVLQRVAPGRYEVIGWNPGRPYAMSHVAAEGAQLSGRTLTVDPGSSIRLSLTFEAGTETVEGVVQRDGKPIAGAMVVLVPKDPGDHPDLFRQDQSDLDGTFALGGVVPGDYTVLAIEDGWDLDWSRPEVIAPYAKRGHTMEVRALHNGSRQMTDAVVAQSK